MKILVVDDMKTMRTIIMKTLGDMGYTSITEAADGSIAWAVISKELSAGAPFDLIISDWNMPNMKGIELLMKVRSMAEMKLTPFILVTAETEKSQVTEAARHGVTDYLTKPFSRDLLKEKVQKASIRVIRPRIAAAG